MTSVLHLTPLNTSNKRSFDDYHDDEVGYHTPPPCNDWKRTCVGGAHFLSPPPTPRHSTCVIKFDFDDDALAHLMLPDLRLLTPRDQPEVSVVTEKLSSSSHHHHSPHRIRLKPRFSLPSPDITLPHDCEFPTKDHNLAALSLLQPQRLSPVLEETPQEEEEEEAETRQDDKDRKTMPPPPPMKPHDHHSHHPSWGRPPPPPSSSSGGTEYARCA